MLEHSAKPAMEGQAYDFNPNATYHEVVYRDTWRTFRSPAYVEYRRLWDEAARNKIELDFPIHLDIETTNICNLKCPMCPRTTMVEQNTFSPLGKMTREQYGSIIDQATEHKVLSIKLNYLGEPFSHQDLVWQIEYAKKKGVLDVMMNTNGSLLLSLPASVMFLEVFTVTVADPLPATGGCGPQPPCSFDRSVS